MSISKEETAQTQYSMESADKNWLLEMDRTESTRKTGAGIVSRLTAKATEVQETPEGCFLIFQTSSVSRSDLESYASYLHSQYPGIDTRVEKNNQHLRLCLSASPLFTKVLISYVQYGQMPTATRFRISLRRFVKKLYRLSSARLRDLPDFLIIGAPRCGTTAMYTQLVKQSCLWSAANIENPGSRLEGKETHFFDVLPHKGMSFYRAHFPLTVRRWRAQLKGDPFLTGEATPNYLFEPGVAQKVRQALPEVRMIVMLRNPVDRAYSHYQMSRIAGLEPLSFEDAIKDEPARLSIINKLDAETAASLRGFYSYLSSGLYADQLESWFELFPRDQFLIIRSEDYYQMPMQFYGRALKFLGLAAPPPPTESTATNQDLKGVVKNKIEREKMNPDTRNRLLQIFEPHNERLRALLGQNFEWR